MRTALLVCIIAVVTAALAAPAAHAVDIAGPAAWCWFQDPRAVVFNDRVVFGLVVHGAVIDWIAVPAAVYFLWVVQALYRGTFHDWNGAPGAVGARVTTPEPATARAG
jgi:hypothetical protein